MARLIAVMGPSGFGKSTSLLYNEELGIEGLPVEETFIINCAGKDLPGKGSMKMYPLGVKPSEGGRHIILDDSAQIADLISYVDVNLKDIHYLVLEDVGMVMGFDVMDGAKKKGYDKWTDLAVNFMKIVNAAKGCKRHNLNIVFFFHTEVGKDERIKIKTAGSMIDNNIYLDGLFTVILEADVKRELNEVKFGFKTKGDGTSTCKAPVGMFPEAFIKNDMGYVFKKIYEYYYE